MADVDALMSDYGIDKGRIPHHIAIIMDGNGRWAKKRLMPRKLGHKQGQKQLKTTLKNCVKLGLKCCQCMCFQPKTGVVLMMKFLSY